MPASLTDILGWVVVAGFLASALLDVAGERERTTRAARAVAAATWVVFALFWLLLVPHYAFAQKSYVEGLGSAAAVPLSLYVGYLVWAARPTLLFLSRAVAVMGLLYLPFQTIDPLRTATIETVARQAAWAMESLGYQPSIVEGYGGYQNEFAFPGQGGPEDFAVYVILACSGIGSIATVSGLVLAVREPLRRRLTALAVVVPVIYVLNVARVVFIVLAANFEWFAFAEPTLGGVFGTGDPEAISYYVSDRLIAQTLSVFVLLGMVWGLLRYLPALSVYVEEVAYLLTGREIDVQEQFAAGE